MVNVLEVIVLANRRGPEEYNDWLQFLVFIAFGVIYIVNAVIAKAKADKKKQETQTSKKQSILRSSLTVKTARDYLKKIIELEAGPKTPVREIKPVQRPKTEPKKPAIVSSEKVDSSKAEKSPIEVESVSPVLFEIGDSESLKRAIVQLEVFGKPLALRGFLTPSDQF